MINPFQELAERLSSLEAVALEIKDILQATPSKLSDTSIYGDFNWFLVFTQMRESTARQKVANGKIPGVKKVGKRLLFDKAKIQQWVDESNPVTSESLQLAADNQFTQLHQRRGGRQKV